MMPPRPALTHAAALAHDRATRVKDMERQARIAAEERDIDRARAKFRADCVVVVLAIIAGYVTLMLRGLDVFAPVITGSPLGVQAIIERLLRV